MTGCASKVSESDVCLYSLLEQPLEKSVTHSNSHPTTSIYLYIYLSKLVIKSTGDVVFMGKELMKNWHHLPRHHSHQYGKFSL